jgi:hypothetical protein
MNSITPENPHNSPCDPHNNVNSSLAQPGLQLASNSVPLPLSEPASESPATPPVPHEPDHLDRVMAMIPRSVWVRKFRANSFASELTPEQMCTLREWFKTLSIPQVQERVAAPPPDCFGLDVQPTTLYRLKKELEADAPYWLADSLDTAVDLLVSEESAAVAPLREALSVMLYSRAIACCENQANIQDIDRLLAAITKVEKLKSPPAPRSSSPRVPAAPARHQVELSIVPPAQRQRVDILAADRTPLLPEKPQ